MISVLNMEEIMDKPQKRKDYLGWTNWETWSCFSHLENNETIYKVLKAHTHRAKNEIILAENIKEVVSADIYETALTPREYKGRGYEELLTQDIVERFVEEVSWYEIAVSLWDSHREPKNDRRKVLEEIRGVR